MRSPATALASRIPFVTTKTAFPTSALYAVKPADAAIWPTNSQRETPSLRPSDHCLWTCLPMVATRIAEESQPSTSVTPARLGAARRAATPLRRGGGGDTLAPAPGGRLPARTILALAAALALLLAPRPAPGAPAAPAAPPVRALVDRCVAAYGGPAAVARAAAAMHEGTVTSILHPGPPGRIARAWARPGKLRVELAYGDGRGEVRVLDGARGWRDGREAQGPALDAMRLQAARLDLPHLLSTAARVTERAALQHEGKALRVLALELAPGLEVEAAIDPASGRILRSRGLSTGPAKVEFVTAYSDFRTVDGVLVPFREGNWANGRTTGETVLERVRFVPGHAAELFRP
jgi:hypothetical protein